VHKLRSEERSELKPSKARLFREDGTTEVPYVGLDLSTQGLGILIQGEATPGEVMRLIAEQVGEITLQIVWSRKDLIKPSFNHIGLKAADQSTDLRGFFSKVFVSEEVETQSPENQPEASELAEEVILTALKALNTDDPSLFRKMNLAHFSGGARAFPFVHESEQYAIVVPSTVNTNVLRDATVEQARPHVKIFKLTRVKEGANLYRAKLVWPKISGAGSGPVLLAEDDDDLLFLMKTFLQKNSFSVLEASDGDTALSLLKRHPEISALVTDLKMPGLSGLELIKRANKELQERGGCPPAIIVSGYVTPDVLKQGKKLGISHWFVKPVETSDILMALGSLIKEKVA
jgi:CheY-like chemotaxis protein